MTSVSNSSGPLRVPRAPLAVIETAERVSSRRSTKWSPASVLMSQRGPHRQPRQHEEQQDAADCEHPSGHSSTCVMLRCSRGFLPGSDSAWATSSPIISIGSFQRMPTPTEYSSGSPHSLNALPVS